MRKNLLWTLTISVFLFLAVFIACTKENSKSEKQISVSQSSNLLGPNRYTCGSFISGTYTGVIPGTTGQYYKYTNATLDLAGVATGATITLVCQAQDVPNRVTVQNGTTVIYSTGWFGTATYGGPWNGTPLGNSLQTITFNKLSGVNTYTLIVETAPPQNMTDEYEIQVYCAGSDVNCGTKPCPDAGDSLCSCGQFYSGSFLTLNTHYTYTPDYDINLECRPAGATIKLFCDPKSIPNRYTVYDGNGNIAASTVWIGTATWTGPWGVASPSSPYFKPATTLTFIKGSTSHYTLRVETVTAPNSSYNPSTDNWEATLSCP